MNPYPCGYCGQDTKVKFDNGTYHVHCGHCGRLTGSFIRSESAIKSWNHSVGKFTPFDWDDKHTQPDIDFVQKAARESDS